MHEARLPPAGREKRHSGAVRMLFGVVSDHNLKAEIGKNPENAFLGKSVAGRRGTAAKTSPLESTKIALFIGDHLAATCD